MYSENTFTSMLIVFPLIIYFLRELGLIYNIFEEVSPDFIKEVLYIFFH